MPVPAAHPAPTPPTAREDFDPAIAISHLGAVDPALAAVIERAGPFEPSARAEPDVFHSLLRAIVYQQLSGKAAGTIHRRMLAALGGGTAPGPAALASVADADLRAAGLSGNKTRAVRGLAAACLDGSLPADDMVHRYSDSELITCYSALRGIGRWTVEMLLIFHLRRPDVLPIHDLGVRKGFAHTYGWSELPKPRALPAACEHWRPYRSVASWYMWRAAEQAQSGANG